MGSYRDFLDDQSDDSKNDSALQGPQAGSFAPSAQKSADSTPTPSPFSAPVRTAAPAPARAATPPPAQSAPQRPVTQAARPVATPAPQSTVTTTAAEPAAAKTPVATSAPSSQVVPAQSSVPARPAASVPATRTSTLPAQSFGNDLAVQSVARKSMTGWRGWLNRFGLSFGLSADEVRFEELWKQSRQRISGTWYVPVIGSGGVTTITMGLGSTFAELRGEKVLAIDADPGFGDLVDRAELERSDERGYTVTDMLGDPQISTYSDCRAYTVMNVSDLEVLAADVTPGRPEFDGIQLSGLLRTIAGHYQLVFSDHGRNIRDSVGVAAFEHACGLVIVCGTTLNDTKSVDRQIAQLRALGQDHLLKRAVLVINQLHGHKPRVSVADIESRYSSVVASIQTIGFDPHLSQGGPVRTELITPSIRRSFVELAAKVGVLIDSKSRGIR